MGLEFHALCPYCGRWSDMTTGHDQINPHDIRAGYMAMCLTCGEIVGLAAGPSRNVRKPTTIEINQFPLNLPVRRMRDQWMRLHGDDRPIKPLVLPSVLDEHFHPFAAYVRSLGMDEDAVKRAKTLYARGMAAVFRLIDEGVTDEARAVDQLERLRIDVERHLQDYPKPEGEKP